MVEKSGVVKYSDEYFEKIKSEIPITKQGIFNYYRYAKKQIKQNKNHITKLEDRMKLCQYQFNKLFKQNIEDYHGE